MTDVSPNPSDRELVLAVVSGKATPEKAAELLRGNDPAAKALILQELAKQTLQVAHAVVLMAKLDAIAESQAKASGRPAGALTCRVSAKGALSVYGLQRMPVTLYVEQWERLFGFLDALRAFIDTQNGKLSRKRPMPAVA